MMRRRLSGVLLIAAALSVPAAARADAPSWADDPCAGLDCAETPAGVGQALLLPEVSISSAIAYAEAVRGLSGSMVEFVSVNARQYGENSAQATDSAVKDMVKSPLGSALTKTYASNDADTISVSILLHPIEKSKLRVYAQEYVDKPAGTLYVRLVMDRSKAGIAPTGFSEWRGRGIKLNSQDVRVGRRNEFTLWVQDEETGLTWIEQWPMGGADLMKNGQVSEKYVFDRIQNKWKTEAEAAAAASAAAE